MDTAAAAAAAATVHALDDGIDDEFRPGGSCAPFVPQTPVGKPPPLWWPKGDIYSPPPSPPSGNPFADDDDEYNNSAQVEERYATPGRRLDADPVATIQNLYSPPYATASEEAYNPDEPHVLLGNVGDGKTAAPVGGGLPPSPPRLYNTGADPYAGSFDIDGERLTSGTAVTADKFAPPVDYGAYRDAVGYRHDLSSTSVAAPGYDFDRIVAADRERDRDYGRDYDRAARHRSADRDYGRSDRDRDYNRDRDYGRSDRGRDYGRSDRDRDYGRSDRDRDYGRSDRNPSYSSYGNYGNYGSQHYNSDRGASYGRDSRDGREPHKRFSAGGRAPVLAGQYGAGSSSGGNGGVLQTAPQTTAVAAIFVRKRTAVVASTERAWFEYLVQRQVHNGAPRYQFPLKYADGPPSTAQDVELVFKMTLEVADRAGVLLPPASSDLLEKCCRTTFQDGKTRYRVYYVHFDTTQASNPGRTLHRQPALYWITGPELLSTTPLGAASAFGVPVAPLTKAAFALLPAKLRVIKNQEPPLALYHGTTTVAAAGITVTGLLPASSLGSEAPMLGPGVYVARWDKASEKYAKPAPGTDGTASGVPGAKGAVIRALVFTGTVKTMTRATKCTCGCAQEFVDHQGVHGGGHDTTFVPDNSLPATRRAEWCVHNAARVIVDGVFLL